jgi:hypothetical protein
MVQLPNEIINLILSFREEHPISIILNELINDNYKIDYNPYFSTSSDCYYLSYSFYEWYFTIIRPNYNRNSELIVSGSNIFCNTSISKYSQFYYSSPYNNISINKYKLTPKNLLINKKYLEYN